VGGAAQKREGIAGQIEFGVSGDQARRLNE
jgi:hypothetical protein